MIIREEKTTDYEDIDSVIKKAFASAEHADGNEPELVNRLRKGLAYVPQLSLVAEINGKIVGYIFFTKAKVQNNIVLALAPLSVLPEYQRQGIGTALLKEGHRIAKTLGYKYVIVLGSENYYPRVGYVPADTFGIQPSFDVPRENFMAYRLDENSPDIHGTVEYAKEFGIP